MACASIAAARRAPSMKSRPAVSRSSRCSGAAGRVRRSSASTREQDAWLDWLHHIVVGAHLQPQHLVDVLGLGREDEDRHRVAPAKLAAQREPVLSGEHEIQDHEIRLHPIEALRHGEAVAHDADVVAVLIEVIADRRRQAGAVLDERTCERRARDGVRPGLGRGSYQRASGALRGTVDIPEDTPRPRAGKVDALLPPRHIRRASPPGSCGLPSRP
jgi:hypothetical protein